MYCTNTNFKNGTQTQDKGLFMEGLLKAVENCSARMEKEPEIESIILLGTEGGRYSVHREAGAILYRPI